MISAGEAIVKTRQYNRLIQYNSIVRDNVAVIEQEIIEACKKGNNMIYLRLSRFLYPARTIDALKDFGYDVETNAVMLKVSWGTVADL